MQEIKKGDIVRRKLRSGILVGIRKVVDDVEEYGVYAHDIPQNSLGSVYYTKKEISAVRHAVLKTTNNELKSIIADNLSWTQHVDNLSWRKALNLSKAEPFSAITLKSSQSHIIVSEPQLKLVHCDGKYYVHLKFVRILEQIIR